MVLGDFGDVQLHRNHHSDRDQQLKRVRKFFDDHQVWVPFLVVALVAGVGLHVVQQNAKTQEENTCKAALESRILIEDLLNFNAPDDLSTLPPEYQEFLTFANERLDTLPEICDGTGITKAEVREDLKESVE